MRQIDLIIVHCSATKEGADFHAADIDRWHRKNGWKGIGYHYVVDLDGTIEGGRPESKIGAHCDGLNKNSIGVCYIGGLAADGKTAKDTRTDAQKKALEQLLRHLVSKYPQATIHGHRDFANKACPSFDATKEYAHLTQK